MSLKPSSSNIERTRRKGINMMSFTKLMAAFILLSCHHKATSFMIPNTSFGDRTRSGMTNIATTSLLRLSSLATDTSSSVMGGVSEFEKWFNSKQQSSSEAVKHASFQDDTLRGLEFIGTSEEKKNIITLPASLVLRSKFGGDDEESKNWDANLSVKILKECLKGEGSDICGYCSLLMKGTDFKSSTPSPPSTAPDALRNWTPEQKKLLESSSIGQRLLSAEKDQQQRWATKYNTALTQEERNMFTKEQFFWAMEAVNSRAFKGSFGLLKSNDDGGISPRAIASFALPVLAAVIGGKALLDPTMNPNDDAIAIGCAVVAALPLLFNTIFSNDDKDNSSAVMLPLIDSANHIEEADSTIEFDPLRDAFTLSIGDKCLVKEMGGETTKTQLYISYGEKKDTELLLNYGFLNDIDAKDVGEANEEDAIRDRMRRCLAEEFVRRNP